MSDESYEGHSPPSGDASVKSLPQAFLEWWEDSGLETAPLNYRNQHQFRQAFERGVTAATQQLREDSIAKAAAARKRGSAAVGPEVPKQLRLKAFTETVVKVYGERDQARDEVTEHRRALANANDVNAKFNKLYLASKELIDECNRTAYRGSGA